MTCIVGIIDPDSGSVYMGADLCVTGSYTKDILAQPKIFFKNEEMLMGCSGHLRFGQIIEHSFNPPEWRYDLKTDFEYLCTDFIHALRECLAENGFGKEAQKLEADSDEGSAIIAFNGSLWILTSDFCVLQSPRNFAVLGSGEPYAQGSLLATERVMNMDPENRINMAIEAASEFDLRCNNMVTISCLEGDSPTEEEETEEETET